jgi:hypothetical protein
VAGFALGSPEVSPIIKISPQPTKASGSWPPHPFEIYEVCSQQPTKSLQFKFEKMDAVNIARKPILILKIAFNNEISMPIKGC